MASVAVKFDYIDFKVEKVPADSQEHESFTVKSSDIKSPLPLKFIKDELELISENDQLICMMCGKNYKTKNQLSLHKNNVHRFEQCSCKICGKTFERRKLLANHMNLHKNKKCLSCEKTFKFASYHKHVQFCKNYNCTICDFETKSRKTFKNHTIQHEMKKEQNCPHCNYSSLKTSNVKRHIRQHNQGMFDCDKCGKQVSILSAEKHKETHTKRLECNICGKHFKLSNAFNKHIAKHSENGKIVVRQEHNCSHCAYKSYFKGNLRKHIVRKHVNPKPNPEKKKICEICNFTFTKSSNLSCHLKKGCQGGRILVVF